MGDFARAISSQVVATAVIAAVNLAKSFLFFKTDKYEDEDGALTVESVLSAMGWDMLSSFMGTIPKGSELYDVLSAGVTGGTYYGIEYSSLSTVTDTISSLLDARSLVTGILDGTQDTSANALLPKIDSIADDVSKLLGIPAENLLSVFYAAERWVFTALEGEYVGEYTLLSQQKAFSSSTSGTYYSLLFEAAERDTTQFAYIYADMIANNLTTEEKIADAMLTRAANAIVTAADTGEGFDEAVSTAEWLVNEGIVDREKLATKVINGLFNDASEDEVNLYDAFTNDIDLYNELVEAFIATGLIEQKDIGKALTSEAKDNLYSALEVSVSEYEALVLALVNEGADYSSIVSSMRSMYNDAVAEDADYSLNQTALDAISSTGSTVDSLTTGELEIYLDSKTGYLEEWKGKIEASSTYRSMSEEVQEAVVTAYTNLANQLALYEATGDEAVFTAKWYYTAAVSAPAQGIDPWKYVLIYRYKNSLSGDIKGQFTTWLASQGLTDAQQEWVLSQFYTTG